MSEGKKSILHVEDNEEIQQYISTLLADLADITSAKTLKEAQALVSNHHYNLILVDFTLPDGSGSELINQMAKQNPSIPVIVFSSHEISNTMVNVKHIFIKRRFSPQILHDTVAKYIQN